MFTFDVEKWVPKFILCDKNGYAIAKAIEAAMQSMNNIVRQGLDCVQDVNKMPEWRLDEMAWEYNILYDYSESVEAKRKWIKDATSYYAKYGTAAAIVKYLDGVFDSVTVEEWWKYGGDPYHFRVIVTGEWSSVADEWAKKAIAEIQNVRSVLDNIIFNAGSVTMDLKIGFAVCGIEVEDTALMM